MHTGICGCCDEPTRMPAKLAPHCCGCAGCWGSVLATGAGPSMVVAAADGLMRDMSWTRSMIWEQKGSMRLLLLTRAYSSS